MYFKAVLFRKIYSADVFGRKCCYAEAFELFKLFFEVFAVKGEGGKFSVKKFAEIFRFFGAFENSVNGKNVAFGGFHAFKLRKAFPSDNVSAFSCGMGLLSEIAVGKFMSRYGRKKLRLLFDRLSAQGV